MKTFKSIAGALFITLLSIGMLSAQDEAGDITTLTEITVKPGHHAQFVEGVKSWKACYVENNGQNRWSIWKREQGEGTVYTIVGVMPNWAEMDKDDPVGKACYVTLLTLISPHIEKVAYHITQNMPEWSRDWPEDGTHAWVTFFKVKKDYLFREGINALNTAVKEKEGSPRGLWRRFRGGSPDGADYMVSSPFKSFADLDTKRDSPAKIHRDVAGDEKADEMRDKWYDSETESWSYIYVLKPELSN